MKLCRICYETKPFSFFSKNITTYDGLSHMCRECCSAYRKWLRSKEKKKKNGVHYSHQAVDFSVSFE
jgi:hypothetical protein